MGKAAFRNQLNSRFRRISFVPVRLSEGPFSIAASVKLRPDEYMLSSSRAPADDAPRGSRFSSRSVSGRLMMELEGWGGDNLNRALAANQRRDRGTLRTHPIRRPREDIFLPKQNALISLTAVFLRSPLRVQATAGTAALSLRQRNSLPSTHIR